MDDVKRLTDLIENAVRDIDNAEIDLDTEELHQENKDLGEAIKSLLSQVQEVCRYTSKMADGDLSAKVPPRHNLLAGSIKDLRYKIEHLTWQAKQVAKGDYSQRVDFMGDFSDSFNYMISELKIREETIRKQADEKVLNIERQNRLLQRQMTRQIAHYQSYRDYTKSFHDFREEYKKMMGKVYDMFKRGEYESGRMLVAHINDLMGSEVNVHKLYSNHEFVNSALLDIANYCQCNKIFFEAQVHIPKDFSLSPNITQGVLMYFSALIYEFFELDECEGKAIVFSSTVKSDWLNITTRYYTPGVLPDCNASSEETGFLYGDYIMKLQLLAEDAGGFFDFLTSEETNEVKMAFHIYIG